MSETLRGLINTWALQTVAMALTALALPKLRITGILGAFGTVAALALVNTTIWDAGLFASLPGSFSVQALQLLGANGLLFWILVKLLPGIEVDGILPALAAPVVYTVLSVLISTYASDVDVIDSVKSIFGFVEETRDHLMVEDPAPE
jgi:uncharacterized membrane protein YvlD (DUF360 family)